MNGVGVTELHHTTRSVTCCVLSWPDRLCIHLFGDYCFELPRPHGIEASRQDPHADNADANCAHANAADAHKAHRNNPNTHKAHRHDSNSNDSTGCYSDCDYLGVKYSAFFLTRLVICSGIYLTHFSGLVCVFYVICRSDVMEL